MFVASSIPFQTRDGESVMPAVRPAPARLLGSLVKAWDAHRALMAWNRGLPRPSSCTHVPDRIWRRRSALLSLRGHRASDRGMVSGNRAQG